MYRDARKSANLTIEEAAFRLHIAPRTLSKYEAGENVPPPEVVLAMSREYKQPWLTQVYCRENCAIGKTYSYEVLNNVALDPPSILLKLVGELKEARDCLGRLLELTVNKQYRRDFTQGEWEEFIRCLLEFLDVEHNIETLKIALGRWCDVAEIVEMHNDKCRRKKYVKKGGKLIGCGSISVPVAG